MTTIHTHEIVLLRFAPGLDARAQAQRMALLGQFIQVQTGFVSRSSYYDEASNAWVDHVTWSSRADAEAAMEKSQSAEDLAPVFRDLVKDDLRIGHYVRMV